MEKHNLMHPRNLPEHIMGDGELDKIFEEVKKTKLLSVEKELEKKLEKLTEKIRNSEGQVISALIRYWDRPMHGWKSYSGFHSPKKAIRCGIITPETGFNIDRTDKFIFNTTLVENITPSYALNTDHWRDEIWEKTDDVIGLSGLSYLASINSLQYLWFMDRPLVGDSLSKAYPGKVNRLQLHIGNEETIPFLEENLRGYEYEQIRNLLGNKIPETEKSDTKKRDEFFELYDKISKEYFSLEKLIRKRDGRIERVNRTSREDQLEDEVSVKLHMNPHINEASNTLTSNIRKAIKRGYKTYPVMTRESTPGVEVRINPPEFFSIMEERYLKKK